MTVTVNLTVRLVAQRDPAAAQLLCLMAFLAPNAIPRDLPAAAPQALPRPLRQVAADPIRLDQAVRVLIENALVAPDFPGHLRVHNWCRTYCACRWFGSPGGGGWLEPPVCPAPPGCRRGARNGGLRLPHSY